jgi:4-hydroxy-tetrahydrodipicolinate synthase
MFTGTYTAIVTPFKNGRVDEPAFRSLIQFQIENGVNGIVPAGTTGEAATLDYDEHLRVIEIAVEEARGRCQIIAGTGSNSTQEAVELTQKAQRLGVDAALVASPYYNKPTQEGVYRHYKKISESSPLKLMLYNVPSRTAGEIGVETCARLARDCANIVSIKEAGGSSSGVHYPVWRRWVNAPVHGGGSRRRGERGFQCDSRANRGNGQRFPGRTTR